VISPLVLPDEVKRAWVRPKKRPKDKRKDPPPPSPSSALSLTNSFSSLRPDSLD
jgi:hypothetical protein